MTGQQIQYTVPIESTIKINLIRSANVQIIQDTRDMVIRDGEGLGIWHFQKQFFDNTRYHIPKHVHIQILGGNRLCVYILVL